ncbi:MAG: TRAM domain-containing protein [Candidatus Levybacteria bacterium]|nr:TRAM domain-containing protein [Candidatus Levybacteria bacterium]
MAKETNKTLIKEKVDKAREPVRAEHHEGIVPTVVDLPAKLVQSLADEVARNVISRLPSIPHRTPRVKKSKLENAVFLDTSAIIDGRVFDVVNMGVLTGTFVIPESILLELKHIADSQDMVKRERGRKGLALLDRLKKSKGINVLHVPDKNGEGTPREVDEKLIEIAKSYKGRLITCDYNLEKKASISGVLAININSLANHLKIKAVPGEALHIRVLHQGKDHSQGVGYLDDGTMLVVENASMDIGRDVDVIVSRVIQTTAGRILFSKKI